MTAIHLAPGLSLPRDVITLEDLHWAAGLFEGEGTVTIGVRKSDETYRLICCVGNTDPQVIEFFHQRWGGWVQPAYGDRPGRKPAWMWTVAGPRAQNFAESILDHVRTDRVRRKLLLGLEFRSFQSRNGRASSGLGYKERQRSIYEALRALNRRGVPS